MFPLMAFVNSITRTFRKVTFPSRKRMMTIKRNVSHLNRLLSCLFWAGWAVGRGGFLSTLSGAHGGRGRTDTRSISRLVLRSSRVRTSKNIFVNLSRMVRRRVLEELWLRKDSMSSGISCVFFSDRGVLASVNEADLSGCRGGESGENLDCSTPNLSGGEIERCSLNLEGFCQGEDVEAMPLEGRSRQR